MEFLNVKGKYFDLKEIEGSVPACVVVTNESIDLFPLCGTKNVASLGDQWCIEEKDSTPIFKNKIFDFGDRCTTFKDETDVEYFKAEVCLEKPLPEAKEFYQKKVYDKKFEEIKKVAELLIQKGRKVSVPEKELVKKVYLGYIIRGRSEKWKDAHLKDFLKGEYFLKGIPLKKIG